MTLGITLVLTVTLVDFCCLPNIVPKSKMVLRVGVLRLYMNNKVRSFDVHDSGKCFICVDNLPYGFPGV